MKTKIKIFLKFFIKKFTSGIIIFLGIVFSGFLFVYASSLSNVNNGDTLSASTLNGIIDKVNELSSWVSGEGASKDYVDNKTNNIYSSGGNVGIGVENPKKKLDINGGLRVGNSIYNIFNLRLPANGLGYSTEPLHLKTDWICGVTHLMYNIEFKGFHFIGRREINAIAVGYLYGSNGLSYNTEIKLSGTVTPSVYCSSIDNKLVFKLSASNDWHASDLIINFIGGDLNYIKNGADSFNIIQYIHSSNNI